MNEDLKKTITIVKEIKEVSIELFSKLESEVLDPDVCCLDLEFRNKAEELHQRLFESYLIAAGFFDEK